MDTSGDKYSKKPLTKARAEKQLKALHINTGHGMYCEGGMMRVSNPLIPQVTPEQEAKAVIQRILDSANSARSMSITMKEGHKSMEKIMNESAMELFKAGKVGAVQYLNQLRAPYESREDYKKEDSTERNKVAREMGLEIKHMGSGMPEDTPPPPGWKTGSGKRKLKGGDLWNDYIRPGIRWLVQNNIHHYAAMLAGGIFRGLIAAHGGPGLERVLGIPQWLNLVAGVAMGADNGLQFVREFEAEVRRQLAQQRVQGLEELTQQVYENQFPPPAIPQGTETALLGDIQPGMRMADVNRTARRFQRLYSAEEIQQLRNEAEQGGLPFRDPLTRDPITSVTEYNANVVPNVGQGKPSEPDTHILIGDELDGSGRKADLRKEYDAMMRRTDLTPQQREDIVRTFQATTQRLNEAGKSYSTVRRIFGLPETDTGRQKNRLFQQGSLAMQRLAPVRLIQRRNPLHMIGNVNTELAQQEVRDDALGITGYANNAEDDEDPDGPPAQVGEGKIKFIKKYLKGQGIPATKKNVAKICNIMDVEGVVFE